MKKRRIRKGDEVVVIAGNDRGRTGKILSFRGENRVVVEGINVRKKHMKKTQQNPKGQIIDIECPIHISNVMPSIEGKAVKLRARVQEDGEKELFYRSEGSETVYRSAKKAQG